MEKSFRVIEEIARFEQRTALRKGRFISLIHTPTIKVLPNEDKKEFFSYLRKKGRNGKFLILFMFSALILSFIFRHELTGNVITENAKIGSMISLIFIALFVVLFVILLVFRSKNKKISQKFKKHVSIADKLIN